MWYIRYWSGYRSTKKRMADLLTRVDPGLVVGDEEFSSVSIALERKIRHVLVSDELELGFANSVVSRYIERKVSRWYASLQDSVSTILVPDFGTDYRNVHFTSPVVRETTSGREDSLKNLGIASDKKVVLLSASGSGIGDFLLKSTLTALESLDLSDVRLIVTGLQGSSKDDKVTYLGVYRDNQNLVAAADLVISTAGKSTIDEAQSYGSPIIAIPIKNHIEQERNAAALGFTHEDLFRMKELIVQHIGKRTAAKNYSGAETISEYLLRPA
jgi:UDP-N-acetylglucosamine--N-acetylmuramyl-(pentapeptide) pyrophosphoryl-undecaprenol N-acetylglucosamine transferase